MKTRRQFFGLLARLAGGAAVVPLIPAAKAVPPGKWIPVKEWLKWETPWDKERAGRQMVKALREFRDTKGVPLFEESPDITKRIQELKRNYRQTFKVRPRENPYLSRKAKAHLNAAFPPNSAAPHMEFWKRGEPIPEQDTFGRTKGKPLRDAIERQQHIQKLPGDYDIIEEPKGEFFVWCHPDDRQAFIDAGFPEKAIVHAGIRP